MTSTKSAEEERRIRYDRQVRLWGSGVQQRLHSTILIVSPGTPFIADEALKNLVLAGIGKVRVIPSPEDKKSSLKDRQDFLRHSVAALSAGDDTTGDASKLPPTKAEMLVNGLRKLNNLVDCKVFDEKSQNDLYEEGKKQEACVIAVIDSSSNEQAQHWIHFIEKITPIDIVCNIRFLTKKYAFCDFSKKLASSSDAAADTVSNIDNSSYLDQPWTPTSPHPPISALLKYASMLTRNKTSTAGKGSSHNHHHKDISFEDFIINIQEEKNTSEAVFMSESEVVEKVAAECLPSCGGGASASSSSLLSCTLNAILGAVLSQQILSHACQVPPAVKQESNNAAGSQPRPVRWLFCHEDPHVECLSGN